MPYIVKRKKFPSEKLLLFIYFNFLHEITLSSIIVVMYLLTLIRLIEVESIVRKTGEKLHTRSNGSATLIRYKYINNSYIIGKVNRHYLNRTQQTYFVVPIINRINYITRSSTLFKTIPMWSKSGDYRKQHFIRNKWWS